MLVPDVTKKSHETHQPEWFICWSEFKLHISQMHPEDWAMVMPQNCVSEIPGLNLDCATKFPG
jgi:hypothetical protein